MSAASRAREIARHLVLLARVARAHLADDPALLLVQTTRRLPPGARPVVGRVLESTAPVLPSLAALGAVVGGRTRAVPAHLDAAFARRPGRLAAEVAVLAGEERRIPADGPPPALARARWHAGDVDGAVRVLEAAGRGATPQAGRLRSERRLLTAGTQLAPVRAALPRPRPSGGHEGPFRVLHLHTNSLPHTQSGYSLRSQRVLAALTARGHRSEVVTRTGYPVMVGRPLARGVDVVDGVPHHRVLPARPGSTPEERLRQQVEAAVAVADRFRPDVLHATTDHRNALVARATSAATGIPWVYEVRGLADQTWIASRPGEGARRLAAASPRAALTAAREAELAGTAGAVVTLSATMARVLEDRGVAAEMITLVPNGVDASLFTNHRTPAAARARVGLPAGPAVLVGTAGAVVDYEGIDVLYRAVAHLLADPATDAALRDRLGVLVVGDGAAAPGLRSLAAELGITGRVAAVGRVPREHARDWVQALDVVVVPRRDLAVTRTVTPQKPIEAMALARPVVVADLPALREVTVAADGIPAARRFPAGDHIALAGVIADLHRSPAATAELVARGTALARTRTWDVGAAAYDAVYARALARGEEGRG